MSTEQLDSKRAGFNKWQMYKRIRDENIGPCLIPKTNRLTARNLTRYLDEFRRVYVKPVDAWGGANIGLVELHHTEIVWTLQGEPPALSDVAEILHHYRGSPAIVQQAIPALLYHGCPFDIRVHMQRDIDETWIYAGEVVRVGGQGIVSNVEISNGKVLPLSSAVDAVLPIQPVELGTLQRTLTEVGHGVCKLLNQYAHIDEVGIDLALDAFGGLWLIEINTNDALGAPSHELFRHLPDQNIYDEICQRASLRNLNTLELLFGMMAENQDECN